MNFEYKFEVHRDGTIIYEGLKNVPALGTQQGKATSEQLRSLFVAIDNSRFFQLNRSYHRIKTQCTSYGSDEAWITITLSTREQSKTVEDYLGCYGGSERLDKELHRLRSLERDIETILDIHRWTTDHQAKQ